MANKSVGASRILQFSERFEHFIVLVLLITLMFVILIATGGLIWMIGLTLTEKLQAGLSDHQFAMPLLHEVFTGFLMILIGLELMKTIVMYLDKHIVHVEVVLSVALIAIARHVIDMDLKASPPLNLIGTGVIIFALAVGYFYFKRSIPVETSEVGKETAS
ncbi:MAG: phosphate-starvation-inducible PsiE family protein [Pyrinomonadaceae bacterium]